MLMRSFNLFVCLFFFLSFEMSNSWNKYEYHTNELQSDEKIRFKIYRFYTKFDQFTSSDNTTIQMSQFFVIETCLDMYDFQTNRSQLQIHSLHKF